MVRSKLTYIENARNLNFGVKEIRNLLQKDSSTGEFSDLNVFCEEHQAILQLHYGAGDVRTALREDLEQRLKQIEELMYLKRIEETLANKVELRLDSIKESTRKAIDKAFHTTWDQIKGMSEDEFDAFYDADMRETIQVVSGTRAVFKERIMDVLRAGEDIDFAADEKRVLGRDDIEAFYSREFRKQVEGVLRHESPLNRRGLAQLRATNTLEGFDATHIPVTEEYVDSYRELIRYELEQQLNVVGNLGSNTEQRDQEEEHRDIYHQASFLADFLSTHIDALHGEPAYLRAFMLNKMRSKEGAAFIDELYHELQDSVSSDDGDQTKTTIQALADRLHGEAQSERKQQVRQLISDHARELELSDQELNAILSPRKQLIGDAKEVRITYMTGRSANTYHERIGRHLEELETIASDMALSSMLEGHDPYRGDMAYHASRQQEEISKLKKTLEEFKDEYYTVDYLVELHFQDLGDIKKQELKKAVNALATVRGIVQNDSEEIDDNYHQLMQPLVAQLLSASEGGSTDKLVEHARAEVEAHLVQKGIPQTHLDRLKKQDPFFDVFTYLRTSQHDEQRHPMPPFYRGNLENDCLDELGEIKYFNSLQHALSAIRTLAYSGDLMTPMGDLERPYTSFDMTQVEVLKAAILHGYKPSEDEPGLLEEKPSLNPDEQSEAFALIKYYQDILEQGTEVEFFTSLEECLETIVILGSANAIGPHIDWDNYEYEFESRPLLQAIEASGFSEHQQQQALAKLEEVMGGKGDDEYHFAENADIVDSDTDPVLSDEEALFAIRVQLAKMEMISGRNFSLPNDISEFKKARREIADEMKVHRYLAEEAQVDELGKEVLYNGKPVLKKVWKDKELPFLDQDRLESLEHQLRQVERYSHLHELKTKKFFEGTLNLENPNDVRDAIEALFGGHFTLERGKSELKMLSKVMTLDHPLTAVRFHAADRKPFLLRDKLQIHRVPGRSEPATYLDRAKHVLQQAQDYIQTGHYDALESLFRDGGIGHRLYVDASFCPVKKLKDPTVFSDLYKQEFREDHVETVLNKDSFRRESDLRYFSKAMEKYESSQEWKHFFDDLRFEGQSLIDDPQFFSVFGPQQLDNVELLAQHQDALRFNEDGTINPELTREALDALVQHVEAGGSVESLGLPGSKKIPKEKLEAIAKDYPLIATRMAQMNSLLAGGAAGGAQLAVRWGVNNAKLIPQGTWDIMKLYWKSVGFWTPLSIWMAIDQMVEHISELADFNTKTAAYDLLQKVFDGTLVGNEFAKLYQSQEDKRVGEFKDAFSDFGHQQVIDRLYTASDQFELKAAFIEGFENRGIITNQDLLDHRLIKNLNRYTSKVTIPTSYTKDEMEGDEEVSFKVLDKMREAIDDIWGEGTWQSWRAAGASKYESERETASKNFEGNSVREKNKWYGFYWELLRTDAGRAKIKSMHPAEIVGNIEQDMMQGDRDVGETFAIMQAMISLGFVKLDHVRRLQTAHSNNLPIHALLEPKEAEIAGLSEFIINNLATGQAYEQGTNDVIEFFQGRKAIRLNAYRMKGKWRFAKTDKEAKGRKIESVVITVHQLQKNREAQPEWHRKMDNCAIGIFTPCYSWNQIEGAMNPNTQGKIEARSHDMIAAYRGIHSEFAAYMDSMNDSTLMTDELTFKRQVWHAYEALCKTQAFAAFYARHRDRSGKGVDFNMNTLDGSPNFSSDHKEIRMQSKTNYESLILGTDGPHQRMAESSAHLDRVDAIDDELRYKFKEMAGFQFVKELGVNKDTGKEDQDGFEPYDYKTYNPSDRWKEVMPLFLENVRRLASKHGFGESISQSLLASEMGNINTTNPSANNARQQALRSWMHGDAGL